MLFLLFIVLFSLLLLLLLVVVVFILIMVTFWCIESLRLCVRCRCAVRISGVCVYELGLVV